MALPSLLPSVALTPDTVPAPDAPDRDVIAFTRTFDAYAEVGQEALSAAVAWFRRGGVWLLTLDELRVALFGLQRAHYHQGGGWPGQEDLLMTDMRAVAAEIHRRVVARGRGAGVWVGDLARLRVDALVHGTNPRMEREGGVEAALSAGAGPALREAMDALPLVDGVRCPRGEARLTPGFHLPARHVIHTPRPVWKGGSAGEADALAAAYWAALALATEHGLGTVAMPALSTGGYGFPPDEAARIAVGVVRRWQAEHDLPVRVVLVARTEPAAAPLRTALGT
jgi:O-acetyl-ADP-ribose deacetylase (regulator of RNase III)